MIGRGKVKGGRKRETGAEAIIDIIQAVERERGVCNPMLWMHGSFWSRACCLERGCSAGLCQRRLSRRLLSRFSSSMMCKGGSYPHSF